jgi:hypothetical protein
LRDILEDVERSGRCIGKLEKAVLRISERLGDLFSAAWDRAWTLHVWGFHEAKFDPEDVRARLSDIERMFRKLGRSWKRVDPAEKSGALESGGAHASKKSFRSIGKLTSGKVKVYILSFLYLTMESLGERVIGEIEANKKLKMRLAELIVSEPDVRLFMINSILPDVAKKEDIRDLKSEIAQLRNEITQLRGEMVQLRNEMHSDFKWTIGIILTIWGATVIPILLRLIGAI